MAYGSTYRHEDDPSYGPDNIGDPINLDPLAGINENRPKFRTRKQQQRAEQYAQALEQDASSTAPLGHWTQALAQVGKGILGGLEEREIDQSDAARRDYLTKALEGDTSAEDLMKQGALYDVPELSDIGKYQAETDWRRSQAEIEQGWKQKSYDLQKGEFDWKKAHEDKGFHELSDGTVVDDKGNLISVDPNRPPPKADLKDILKVSDDVKALPTYKTFAGSIPIYNSMHEAVTRPTGGTGTTSDDLLIIHSLAKIFDPTSIVMQGEQEAVKNSANLPTQVWGYINFVTGGHQLTPQLKKEILAAAKLRMDQYKSSYEYQLQQYTGDEGLLKRHNIPPGDVVPTLEPYDVETQY